MYHPCYIQPEAPNVPPKLQTIPGANITRTGSKTKASVSPSNNKAERAAIAEVLEGKVAAGSKPSFMSDSKPKKEVGKVKKELYRNYFSLGFIRFRGQIRIACTSGADARGERSKGLQS